MTLRSITLIGTTASNGAATIELETRVFGRLVAVQWIDGDLIDGVDAALSVQDQGGHGVGSTLLTLTDANSDAMYYPRAQAHDNTGTALAYNTDGEPVTVEPLIAGRLRLVISDGGDKKTGGCVVYYQDRS